MSIIIIDIYFVSDFKSLLTTLTHYLMSFSLHKWLQISFDDTSIETTKPAPKLGAGFKDTFIPLLNQLHLYQYSGQLLHLVRIMDLLYSNV